MSSTTAREQPLLSTAREKPEKPRRTSKPKIHKEKIYIHRMLQKYRLVSIVPRDVQKFPKFCSVVVQSLSHARLFVTALTVAHQAPLSMEFSRQECWNRLPFPTPGDLPDLGIRPRDQTYISCSSCFARQIIYHCATWEAQVIT